MEPQQSNGHHKGLLTAQTHISEALTGLPVGMWIIGMCGITGHEATIKNIGSRDRRKSEFPEMGSDKTMRSLIYSN